MEIHPFLVSSSLIPCLSLPPRHPPPPLCPPMLLLGELKGSRRGGLQQQGGVPGNAPLP